MKRATSLASPELEAILMSGGVAVIRTDTLYGLVARALDEQAVERVYRIKGRTATKQPIVLLASRDQLLSPPPDSYAQFLDSTWPGPNSVIIPTPGAPDWLARGAGTVAYRLPDNQELTKLIAKTGPLIAPSANPEGFLPASTIEEAINYFGDSVDIYVDGGKVDQAMPSALYRLDGQGEPERLR